MGICVDRWFLVEKSVGKVIFGDFLWKKCGKVIFGGKKCEKMIFGDF